MSERIAARETLNALLASLEDVRSFWEAVTNDAEEPRRAATTAEALLESTKSDVDTLVDSASTLGGTSLDSSARAIRSHLERLLVDSAANALVARISREFNEDYFKERKSECEQLAEAARQLVIGRFGEIGDDEDDEEEEEYEEEEEQIAEIVSDDDPIAPEDTYALDDNTFALVRARLEAEASQRKRARDG